MIPPSGEIPETVATNVNCLLAQLAMIFWLGDSFVAMLARTCDFVKLDFYISAQKAGVGSVSAETLAGLMRTIAATAENIGGISFGMGSLLFFYLIFKSRYIPRPLSGLCFAALVTKAVLYIANLIFPEHHASFQRIYLPPMALADVVVGFYLMISGIKIQARLSDFEQHPPITRGLKRYEFWGCTRPTGSLTDMVVVDRKRKRTRPKVERLRGASSGHVSVLLKTPTLAKGMRRIHGETPMLSTETTAHGSSCCAE